MIRFKVIHLDRFYSSKSAKWYLFLRTLFRFVNVVVACKSACEIPSKILLLSILNTSVFGRENLVGRMYMILLVAQKRNYSFRRFSCCRVFPRWRLFQMVSIFYLYFEIKWDFISVSYTCWKLLHLSTLKWTDSIG